MVLPPALLAEHEKAARAAIDRMKQLDVIKSKKGDWRLVAAAQALRAKAFADEIDAAAAMGKEIKQIRDVSNWSKKLEELAERERQDGAAPALTSLEHVQAAWVEEHLPGISHVAAEKLVLSANKRHGTRSVTALAETPGGSKHPVSTTVDYTLPPDEGERESAAKRRKDRHRDREVRKLRSMDLSGALEDHRAVEAERAKAQRALLRAARADRDQLKAVLRSMVTRVELLNGWIEDHSFHWLARSHLQLLDWPSHLGYTHGRFGMPLCKGDVAWLVDPQNAQPPRLAGVSRWFSNGHAEFALLDDACRASEERRVVQPAPGVVLSLDERRPRYVGEHVRLWPKRCCAALRGTAEDVESRAASAKTCPDYRPLGSLEAWPANVINSEMYRFHGLGYDDEFGHFTDCLCEDSLQAADSVLAGRSILAVVTAVHPNDKFVVSSTSIRLPRKFFVQARSGEASAQARLGKQKFTESVKWVTGSVDVTLYDACSATFTGPTLEHVPLFLVNGTGYSASILEAKLVAQAALFRLFEDDLGNDCIEPAIDRIAAVSEPEQLASQLCEWPSTIGVEPSDEVIEHLLQLQESATCEATMQAYVAQHFLCQHSKLGADLTVEDLSGEKHFPEKLGEEPGVIGFETPDKQWRVVQDYDPDPHPMPSVNRLVRNWGGIYRTDYLLW